jgi:hypothetical protein
VLAAVCAAIVFLPPQGRVGTPLHDLVTILLGPTAFALPLGLAFVGVIMTLQRINRNVVLPRRRLAGVALVTLGVIAAEHLLGGTSLVGAWLTAWLIDALGEPLTVALWASVVAAGAWLAFDVQLKRTPGASTS